VYYTNLNFWLRLHVSYFVCMLYFIDSLCLYLTSCVNYMYCVCCYGVISLWSFGVSFMSEEFGCVCVFGGVGVGVGVVWSVVFAYVRTVWIRYVALSGHCTLLCACMCSIRASNGLFPKVFFSSMISSVLLYLSLHVRPLLWICIYMPAPVPRGLRRRSTAARLQRL